MPDLNITFGTPPAGPAPAPTPPDNPVWAVRTVPVAWTRLALKWGTAHWSRLFEYPWVVANGGFRPGQWVLDAAGGDGVLQGVLANECGGRVVNVDNDPAAFARVREMNPEVLKVHGDLRALPFPDGSFGRVVCVSVLEHIPEWGAACDELKRVLAPGGRLLVTADVANYARWNHAVDLAGAARLLAKFGLKVPPVPADARRCTLPEIDRKPGDPETVELRVLCFHWTKPQEEK